ncbi:MAG: hypothetical protein JWQ11_4632, partial [Rhizobacter sp.]|nr:hypothetical protein [Rhizobacter sp.]
MRSAATNESIETIGDTMATTWMDRIDRKILAL